MFIYICKYCIHEYTYVYIYVYIYVYLYMNYRYSDIDIQKFIYRYICFMLTLCFIIQLIIQVRGHRTN